MKIFIMRGILQRFRFRMKGSSERVGRDNETRENNFGGRGCNICETRNVSKHLGKRKKKVRVKFLSLRCLSVELDTEEELDLCVCIYIYIHIYKPVARCQTLEEQWQRAVMRRRSSATRNKEVVDVADATLCATTLLFGIPPFYETPVLLLRR